MLTLVNIGVSYGWQATRRFWPLARRSAQREGGPHARRLAAASADSHHPLTSSPISNRNPSQSVVSNWPDFRRRSLCPSVPDASNLRLHPEKRFGIAAVLHRKNVEPQTPRGGTQWRLLPSHAAARPWQVIVSIEFTEEQRAIDFAKVPQVPFGPGVCETASSMTQGRQEIRTRSS